MGHPSFRLLSRLSLLVALLSGGLAVAPAHAQFVYTDTSVGYRWGDNFKEPGIGKPGTDGTNIEKSIVSLTHSDGYKYGENFINIDALFSNAADPANHSTQGATEVYAVYRHNLSMNAVTGTEMFKYGLLRDLRFELGGDFNTKNTAFAPEKRLLVFGPNFALDIGQFFNIGLHYAEEWNNNGIVGKSVAFDPTFELEIAYGIPFHVAGIRLKYEGFANVVAPKGKDGFGAQTVTEFLWHSKLKYDLGQALIQKEHLLDVGLGFEYWLNKFGNDHNLVPGSQAYTPFVFAQVYF